MSNHTKKIKIFLVEDEKFDLVKGVIDHLLGKDNYNLTFACCMKSGAHCFKKCEDKKMVFDLLLFDVRLREIAFSGCAYIKDFYNYLGENVEDNKLDDKFGNDMSHIDLGKLNSDASKEGEGRNVFWKNGGLLLWAKFLKLYSSNGWRFRSIIFTAYSEIIEQYKFLENTGIVKTTDKIFGGSDSRLRNGGSTSSRHPIYANYRYHLKDYYGFFVDQLHDGRSFKDMALANKIIFSLPSNSPKTFSFNNYPGSEEEFIKALEVDSLDGIILEYETKDNAFQFTFKNSAEQIETSEVSTRSAQIAAEVGDIIGGYVKNIQSEKHKEEVLSIDPGWIDERIRSPLEENGYEDYQLQDSGWTFKRLFCYQYQGIMRILESNNNDDEKKQEIQEILFEIKRNFSQQDLAWVFGEFFKKGGTERITHSDNLHTWSGYHTYAGRSFGTDPDYSAVYQDSVQKLREIIRALPDTDKRLIWCNDNDVTQGLSKIGPHLKNGGNSSNRDGYKQWLLALGDGGNKHPKASLLRLCEKKDFLLDAIPSDGDGITINKECDNDNDTTIFLPRASFKDALESIFVETIQQAKKATSTCLDINIEFINKNPKLFISIAHNGTKGYFQSDNIVNKNSTDLESKDIETLLSVNCLKPMLNFRNWFDFYLITKCKDDKFAIIDVFKKKKLSKDQVGSFIIQPNNMFSIYYIFGVSEAPKTPNSGEQR